MNCQIRISQCFDNNQRCNEPCRQRRYRNTLHTTVKSIQQNSIAADIDNVHQKRDLHGNLGISNTPKQSCTGIVDCDQRHRCHYDLIICIAVCHDLRFYIAKDKRQKPLVKDIHDCNDDQRKRRNEQKQLISCFSGLRFFFLSQELTDYHCATCGQCRHDGDQKHHNGIYQGNSRYRFFSNACHHKGIGDPDSKHQQLLHKKGPQETDQILVGEHPRANLCARSV